MDYLTRCWMMCNVFCFMSVSNALAQIAQDAPEAAVRGFSDRMIVMINGPIVKLLGVVILLVGVASLLRGRQTVALSCGVAFVVLLFLPFFLTQLGGR